WSEASFTLATARPLFGKPEFGVLRKVSRDLEVHAHDRYLRSPVELWSCSSCGRGWHGPKESGSPRVSAARCSGRRSSAAARRPGRKRISGAPWRARASFGTLASGHLNGHQAPQLVDRRGNGNDHVGHAGAGESKGRLRRRT